MTTLGFERGTSATTGHRRFEKELDAIIDKATRERAHRRPGRPPAPGRGSGRRSRSCGSTAAHAHGRRARTARTSASPRSAPPTRCSGRETHREAMKLAIDILGPEAQILTGRSPTSRSPCPATARRHGRADYPVVGHAVVVLLHPVGDDLGRHAPRSSATSSASGCSACPRSRSPAEHRRLDPSRRGRAPRSHGSRRATRPVPSISCRSRFALVDDDTHRHRRRPQAEAHDRLQRLDNVRAHPAGDACSSTTTTTTGRRCGGSASAARPPSTRSRGRAARAA